MAWGWPGRLCHAVTPGLPTGAPCALASPEPLPCGPRPCWRCEPFPGEETAEHFETSAPSDLDVLPVETLEGCVWARRWRVQHLHASTRSWLRALAHPQVAAHLMGSVSNGVSRGGKSPATPAVWGLCFNGDVQVDGQHTEGTARLSSLWLVRGAFLSSRFSELSQEFPR